VVCVSSKAKIKGVIERVPRMKEKKENIDILLQRNATEQMAGVGWDELNAAILKTLDEAERSRACARRYKAVFKVAAGIIAAAAVVFIAVIVNTGVPPVVQFENRGNVVVKLIDKKGVDAIEIKLAESKARVMVDIETDQRKLAKVDVEIIDRNGQRKENDSRPAWIIISRPEPVFADNGINRDEIDLICLM